MKSVRSVNAHSQPHTWPGRILHLLGCAVLLHLLPSCQAPAIGAVVRASDVQIPASLGEVTARFDAGQDRPLVFIIGESHVNLPVQQAVADVLMYLHGVYSVSTVCSEGFSGPLSLPAGEEWLIARRAAARIELLARHINGAEYFALTNPGVHVIGVENMEAYKAHEEALANPPLLPEMEEWAESFQRFLANDLVASLDSERDAERVAQIMQEFSRHRDLDRFVEALQEVVGGQTAVGRKLASLLAERTTIVESFYNAFMQKRDRFMAMNTQPIVGAIGAVSLVVGSLHLPGLEDNLKAAGVSHVSIMVAGASPDSPQASQEDEEIYDIWRKRTPSDLEKWLSQHKPLPALSRAAAGHQVAVLNAFMQAYLMLLQGSSLEEIQTTIARAELPGTFQVVSVYNISDGSGIAATFGGDTLYAYFTSQVLADTSGFTKLYEEQLGDRYLTVVDGGGRGGGDPPIPPILPSSPEPPRRPDGRYIAAIADMKRERSSTVVIRFSPGYRWVNGRKVPLLLAPAEIRKLFEAFKSAAVGPEMVLAAQRIKQLLLVDIDRTMTDDEVVLYQISDDDSFADVSLPFIAALAGGPGAERLSKIEEVYTVPLHAFEEQLGLLNRKSAPVDIATTAVLFADALQSEEHYTGTVEALLATGAHVNELPEGGTLILVGTAGEWSVTLRDGTTISPAVAAFEELIRRAGAVVTINFELPRRLASQPRQLRQHTFEDALTVTRDIVEEIQKNSGRETLDRTLRSKEDLGTMRDQLTRQAEGQALKEGLTASLELAATPTLLQRV